MDLKKRLMFSNVAIVVIPVLLTFAAFFLVVFIASRLFNMDMSYGKFKKLAEVQYQFFKNDASQLVNTPDVIFENEFQNFISSKLENADADIVVLKGHKQVFSTIAFSIIDVEKCLKKGNEGFFSNVVELDAGTGIVRAVPVVFRDGEKGNVILANMNGGEWLTVERLIFIILAVFIISFLLTNIYIILGFSKRILKPLGKLQEAADKISEGSLEFVVIEDGDAEIKQLCRAFEQMRLKLVEGEHRHMKYDASRKMLLSSISHDLKTPITSIRGYVEGILDGVANTPEKVEKYLRTVYVKTTHIDRMIDDLFLYSKLDLNQVPFELEKTDLLEFFKYCIDEIEAELEKSNIGIELHNETRTESIVMVDREKLRRVVLNIIENSRKYMCRDDGKIDIILRETNPSIITEIRDNGAGIDEKDLSNIFDRFYRADTARATMKGSGLGLAIAKQIIEGLEGKIWAISAKGESTSIIISLRRCIHGGGK
jgi:signal transduction histidine kinase